jgi:hypothetical protein
MIFALVLGGAVASERLSALTISGLPIHVIVGLGGWLTFTAVGVSYRLLSMFMLAPELEGATTRATFHVGSCALAAAVVGGVGAICFGQDLSVVLLAVGALGLVAVALYGRDMLHLYRERKRRTIELNCRMAAMALVSLALAVVLLVIASATGNVVRWIGAILFLLAFGWLTGLALAKLYKIVPFLTWLECCGPVLGKQPTPRVQDLVVEKRALKWFLLYYAAVWSGTVVLLLDYGVAFRVPAALMLIATLGIIAQLLRARRLSDLKSEPYREFGLRRPGLLLSTSQRQ